MWIIVYQNDNDEVVVYSGKVYSDKEVAQEICNMYNSEPDGLRKVYVKYLSLR